MVGAAPAGGEVALGFEGGGANVGGRFLDGFLGLIELFRIARGFLNFVFLQIIERQADRVQLEDFFAAIA